MAGYDQMGDPDRYGDPIKDPEIKISVLDPVQY